MHDNKNKNASLSSIMVAVRIRPFSTSELELINGRQITHNSFASAANLTTHSNNKGALRKIVHALDDHVLVFDPPADSAWGEGSAFKRSQVRFRDEKFAFDKVFNEDATQENVFSGTSKDLIEEVLNGFNSTVFAYGATGCGKTHTISGTPEQPGIIFLTMKELYDRLKEAEQEKTFKTSMSYLEVYNETIRDLLISSENRPNLRLREVANGGVVVAGLSEHYPKDVEEVMQLIMLGNQNRTMSPTEANATSSRSHAVIQINIRQQPRTQNISSEYTVSTLSFIDLAGSERAATTKNKSVRMVEGANINRSLLGEKNAHIPYRNSNLTRLLKFSLGGNCKTVMIVCVSPSSSHLEETYNTLKYADRAKNIKTRIAKNTLSVNMHVSQYVNIIKELRKEISELKNRAEFGDRKSLSSTNKGKDGKNDDLKLLESTREKIRKSYHKIYARELDYHQKSHLIETCTQRLKLLNSWIHACSQISSNSNNHFTNKIKDTVSQLESRRTSLERDVMFAAQALERTKGVQLQQISSFAATAKDRLSPLMIKILDQDQILLEKEFDNALLKFKNNGYGKALDTNQPLMEQFMALNASTIVTFKDYLQQCQSSGIDTQHLDNIYTSSISAFTQASQMIPQVNDKFDKPFIGSAHTTPIVQKTPNSITNSPSVQLQNSGKVSRDKPLQSILKGSKRNGALPGDAINGTSSSLHGHANLPRKKVRIVADSPVSKKIKNGIAVTNSPNKPATNTATRTPMKPIVKPKPPVSVSKVKPYSRTVVSTPKKPINGRVTSKPNLKSEPNVKKKPTGNKGASVFDRLSRPNKPSTSNAALPNSKTSNEIPTTRPNGNTSLPRPNNVNGNSATKEGDKAAKLTPRRPVSPTKQAKPFSYKSISNITKPSPSILRPSTAPKTSSPLANPKNSVTSSSQFNLKPPQPGTSSLPVQNGGTSLNLTPSPLKNSSRSVFDSPRFNLRPRQSEQNLQPGTSSLQVQNGGLNLNLTPSPLKNSNQSVLDSPRFNLRPRQSEQNLQPGTGVESSFMPTSPLLEPRRPTNLLSSPLLGPRRPLNLPTSPQIQLRRQVFQPTSPQPPTSTQQSELNFNSPQIRISRSSLTPSAAPDPHFNGFRTHPDSGDSNLLPNRSTQSGRVTRVIGDDGGSLETNGTTTTVEPIPIHRPSLTFPRMTESYNLTDDLDRIDRELDRDFSIGRQE